MKNCPNCGAVIDTEENKCPFCGTIYFDMTSIDFTEGKPVVLKLKMSNGRNTEYLTMLCIPRLENLRFEEDYADISENIFGLRTIVTRNRNLFCDVSFNAIPDSRDVLCETVKEEE